MANLEDLTVNLRLNADQMKAGLAQAQGGIKNLGSGMQGAIGPVKSLTGAMGGLLKSLLPIMAATAVISFLKDSAKAAAEDNTAQMLLARQMKATVGATKEQVSALEEQITALEKVSGVTDDEIRPSFTKLLLATKDTSKAMEMQKLAMDVSAATGKSLTAVTMAFSRAAAGNDTALNRLVPSIKNVTDKTGFLHKNFDGAAKAAADTNPYKRMAVAIDNIKEGIGRGLLPIVQVISDLLIRLAPIFDLIGKAIGKIMDPVMKLVQVIIDSLMPPIEMLVDIFMELFDAAMEPISELIKDVLVPAIKMIAEWLMFLMPIIKEIAKRIGQELASKIKLLTDILKPLVDMIQWLWIKMKPVLRGMQIFNNVLGQIADQLNEKFGKAMAALHKFLEEKIIPIWNRLKKAMDPFAEFVRDTLVANLKKLLNWLKPIAAVVFPLVFALGKLLDIKIDWKAAMKVDDTAVDEAVKKAEETKASFDLFGGGSLLTGGGGKDKPQNVTNINTNVLAKTDANPTDIAANIVNAIKFNLPVAMAGGTGILPTTAGSQLGMVTV